MGQRIDVYHHLDFGAEFQKIRIILLRLEKLMATTHAEFLGQVKVLAEQLDKVRGEITAQVAALQTALENAANVPQDVLDAFEALKGKVQGLDDLNPDAE